MKDRILRLATLAAVVIGSATQADATVQVAVHRRDAIPLPSDSAFLYDGNGLQTGVLSASGTSYSPSGYYLQSMDYDATTGNVYGLVRAASHANFAHLLSWDSSGVLLSDTQLAGYPTDGVNYGMDMSVHNGIAAVHRRDTLNIPNDYALLYNTSGSHLATLSTSGITHNPSSSYLQSLDFDATTGNVFGLARDSSNGTAWLMSWSSSGALLSDNQLSGYPLDGTNYGMDISVHDGIVAVHRRDTVGMTGDSALLYNTVGTQIGVLSTSGTAFDPGGYYLQSLDFDATTGDVYGLVRAASAGSTARLLSWDSSGALLSDTKLGGYPTDGANYGLDMTVLSVANVPETSTLALWVTLGGLGLIAARRRRKQAA